MCSFDRGQSSLDCDAEGQVWYLTSYFTNAYKNSMSEKVYAEHMDHLVQNFNPQTGDRVHSAFLKGGVGRDEVEVELSPVMMSVSASGMMKKAKKGRVNSTYDTKGVKKHWHDSSYTCVITGITHKTNTYPLSLDRITDDRPHDRDDCVLMSLHLNRAKNKIPTFVSRDALNEYRTENNMDNIDDFAVMCSILRPIMIGMIQHWKNIRHNY